MRESRIFPLVSTSSTNGRSPRCTSARKSRCDPDFRVSTSSWWGRAVRGTSRSPVPRSLSRGAETTLPRAVKSWAETIPSRSSIESTRSSTSSIPSLGSSPSAYAVSIAFASAAYERASCWISSRDAARVKNIRLATIISATLATRASTRRNTKLRRRAACAIARLSFRPILRYSARRRGCPITATRYIARMAVRTEQRSGRPAGLAAATVAEAFQVTARGASGPDALRTKDDELSMSWREYADKVRATAAGLAGLGLERGEHDGADAHEPARVPLVRCRGHAPRRHAVLALQHVHGGADPVPGEGRRGAHRGHRGGVRGARAGARRGRPRGRRGAGRRGAARP